MSEKKYTSRGLIMTTGAEHRKILRKLRSEMKRGVIPEREFCAVNGFILTHKEFEFYSIKLFDGLIEDCPHVGKDISPEPNVELEDTDFNISNLESILG